MIDKSVEYKSIVMIIDGEKVMATPEPTLPEGFSFRFFQDEEDIAHWCRIETSVGEFDSEAEARAYFMQEFYHGFSVEIDTMHEVHQFHTKSPHLDEMKRRCVFILNNENLPIATTTCWFSKGEITSQIHWVAVCPEYQGLGLGKAVTQKAITVSAKLAPNQPMWLGTQTNSHRAVLMYHKMGFVMVKNEMQLAHENTYVRDYAKAIEILATVLKPEDVLLLQETAV